MMEEVHAVQRAGYQKQYRVTDCKFCGKSHDRNKVKCPAYGKKCKKCGKENHFAVKCKMRAEHSKKRSVHNVAECDSDEYEDILCVTGSEAEQATDSKKETETKLFAGMLLGKDIVKFQIDCGATCNVIPVNLLNPDTRLEDTKTLLVMYNKSKLRPLGKCKLKLRNPRNQKLYQLEFQVVNKDCSVPLLGKRASEAMKLIKVHYENIMALDSIVTSQTPSQEQWTLEQIRTEYADVFTGDGCLDGVYKVEIDESIKPVQLPKRRVPVAMMKPLKDELQDLVHREIISPVERSTDWISGMVVVQKSNGKPRVCIDTRPLNKALKRSHFPMPTIEDILPDLSKAKVFTVCDVKSGFWHVKLEEESSYLTTFSTPFGRYRWLRMPMGISTAPEIFQRKLTQALENLPGLYIIADDILITGQGETQEAAERDHDDKLRLFLNRCRQKNIKLNAEKLKLRQKEVAYIGHLLTADGLKIDPEKVRAINEMPQPADVKAVQRLLGMVNYLAKFCPHLSDQCEVLRKLTHKDCEWSWNKQHEDAFIKLKGTITNAPVLKYYSPEEELTVQCDASDTGLGAALMQNGKPIAFASRALTQTERGYAQIEKEFLALVFSMEKFHQFTYGRKVTVQSDHKPLENIVKKPLLSAPKRLQRMMLRIQKYDVDVMYVPGKDMLLADTLSRAYLPEHSSCGSVEAEIETVNMVLHLPISEQSLNAIRVATEQDATLQTLQQTISKGWPNEKCKVPSQVRLYFSFKEELSFQDGIIFRGERAIVPDSLRKEIIQRIHSSHLGVEGCLRRARECVYWPGMTEQIKTHVAKCEICRSLDVKQQRETLLPHEMPNRPWAKVGTDLFCFDNRDYLITVDYYSNFWEIDYLPDTKSTTVIKKLKAHFARQGIPDTVISDNGPQFTSQEFKRFSRQWEFHHRTSSPGHAQSNGKAESAVKTAKKLLLKAKTAGQDPYLAMLDHRNTPSQGLNSSPAQRLLSRCTRTLLPTRTSLLQPTILQAQLDLKSNQQRQCSYYNRFARDLHTLKNGDRVRVQPFEPHTVWRPGTVGKQIDERSYEVHMDSGGVLRRNRKHLRSAHGLGHSETTHPETVRSTSSEVDTQTCTDTLSHTGNCSKQLTTRSGRTVTLPQRYKDFVMYKGKERRQ
uniref:Gypsy retrotransposon integrase-like protein 1 n=1 Tax=Oryzias sinensis TaxID=183150 RepID=A0A8C7YWC8_9TELE